MSNKDVKVEECKFFKKVYLGKHCELFKTPCYGKHCNFHKEFIKLAQLEQQLKLKDKMIEKVINYQLRGRTYCDSSEFKKDYDEIYNKVEQQSLAELRGE